MGKEEDDALLVACEEGDLAGVDSALGRGAHINCTSDHHPGVPGITPLMHAASRGHLPVAEVLVAAGAHLDAQDKWGWAAIHRAAHGGRPDIVQLLVRAGADVHVLDKAGRTAMHLAMEGNRLEVGSVLLEADPLCLPKRVRGQGSEFMAALRAPMVKSAARG
eukprot:CAMPEP_0175838614 /NCGR_PEP_ID=MMETSP0107_2-20121207/18351_1 /TAXON_ID=195067 ORGANISM="Goniomonas pacifica, Strain CCMP1869" /NCGR_SAMPLE_ID=MMETSP0107_2 /ASSEMBLY_ACC=CAM_ASM_000203 /LENGTH=162 /DNA_ID=CAMNT_0017152249 /DNA_START=70 /DNA_END=558 /DNA_ORIENTATION=-